jgi:glycosyltransferase involved in cell wall biosynthesis
MRIIVSHSGKQHIHHLIHALLKEKHEVVFYTLFWYCPEKWYWKFLLSIVPKKISHKIENELRKKYSPLIDGAIIKQLPFIELIRKIALILFKKRGTSIQFWADRYHDEWVAKQITKVDFDIFIGYEMSSYSSFNLAKSRNKNVILDLAQIHYEEIKHLSHQHHSLSHIKDDRLRKKINGIKKLEYQLANQIITLSDFAYQSMLKYGIPKDKLVIANLGYNDQLFQFKEKQLKKKHFNLLYVGAIIKRKGIIELKSALEQIIEEYDFKLSLSLIGGMVDEDVFKDTIVDFTHYPFMSHDKLIKAYQEADLFVFPSLLDSWAMVVIESMGCGTPVIITENTGAKDAVLAYGGGKVIAAGDVKALKNALLDYFHHPEEVLKDSLTAKEVALNFKWEKYYFKIGEVIKAN